ncbi:nuclear transport factor 2 family protein [Streptomyces sp. NPDC054784]
MREQGRDREQVRAAVEGELRLLDPEVRASARLVRELLDPEFTEFGASGRRWDRDSVTAALAPESSGEAGHGGGPGGGPGDEAGPGGPAGPITATELVGTLLAPGIVHLTYVSERNGRRVRRSSLWRHRTGAGWLLYFHQGTPTAPADPGPASPAAAPDPAAGVAAGPRTADVTRGTADGATP